MKGSLIVVSGLRAGAPLLYLRVVVDGDGGGNSIFSVFIFGIAAAVSALIA